MRSMSLVVDLIDLVTKHKSGELRCPATALIFHIGKNPVFSRGGSYYKVNCYHTNPGNNDGKEHMVIKQQSASYDLAYL